jgi:hypothetical protein
MEQLMTSPWVGSAMHRVYQKIAKLNMATRIFKNCDFQT